MTRVFYNCYFHYHLKNKRNVTLTRERTYMMIYLDYAATTPMSVEALQTYMKAASQYFGNEQSLHDIGGTASSLLQVCRKTFADMIGGKEQGYSSRAAGQNRTILRFNPFSMPKIRSILLRHLWNMHPFEVIFNL